MANSGHIEVLDKIRARLSRLEGIMTPKGTPASVCRATDVEAGLEAPLLCKESLPKPSAKSCAPQHEDDAGLPSPRAPHSFRELPREAPVTFGQVPRTGPHDFDWCFVFHLPDRVSYFKDIKKRRQSMAYDERKRGSLSVNSLERKVTQTFDAKTFDAKRFCSCLGKAKKTVETQSALDLRAAEIEADTKQDEKEFREMLSNHSKMIRQREEKNEQKELRKNTEATAQRNSSLEHLDFEERLDQLLQHLVVEERLQVDFSGRLKSLEDARTACITMLLSWLYQEEEHFYVRLFSSTTKDELFVCVKLRIKGAKQAAHDTEYKFKLGDKQMEEHLNISLEKLGYPSMEGAWINYSHHVSALVKQYPHEEDPSQTSMMQKADQIRLLYDKLTNVFDLEGMQKWLLIKDFFPCHSRDALVTLSENQGLANLKKWWDSENMPLEEIHHYFGGDISLYFVTCHHLCRWLRWLVAVVVVVIAIDMIVGHSSGGILATLGGESGVPELRIVLGLFTVFWCEGFVLSLRRRLDNLFIQWGVHSDELSRVKEKINGDFRAHAHIMPSVLNQNINDFDVEPRKRQNGVIMARCACAVSVVCALAVLSCILKVKAFFEATGYHTFGQVTSMALTVEIKVFNVLWGKACHWLTAHEHIRNQSDYDNSVAYKQWYVSFLNTFSTFYYIAFLMQPWGDVAYEVYGNPWGYLTFQLSSTISLYFLLSFVDLGAPLIQLWYAHKKVLQTLKDCGKIDPDSTSVSFSWIELQSHMPEYTGSDTCEDYREIFLPLGFVLCFGTALPVASLAVLGMIGLQMRVDGFKFTKAMRRPFPRRIRPSQWIWLSIIEGLLRIAAITNIGLVCFVMEPMSLGSLRTKTFNFLLMFSIYVILVIVSKELYPTRSTLAELTTRRNEYQENAVNHYLLARKGDGQKGEDGHKRDKYQVREKDISVSTLQGISDYKFGGIKPLDEKSTPEGVFQAEVPGGFCTLM